MDPQLKSVVTSIAMSAATAATTWGVGKGFVPDSVDQTGVANAIVTLGFAVATGLFGWLKAHQNSQAAMITAVNAADNGVKVVAATPANEKIPLAKEPLKGPAK